MWHADYLPRPAPDHSILFLLCSVLVEDESYGRHAHFISDSKFPLEKSIQYLDFVKFIVEKLSYHIKLSQTYFKVFQRLN
jgi:hypothetical protein